MEEHANYLGVWIPHLDYSDKDLPSPLYVSNTPDPINSFCLAQNWGFFLTRSGEIYEITINENHKTLNKLQIPIKITKVACNTTIAIAIEDSGNVYAWGNDTIQAGLLGVTDVYKTLTPILIENLTDITQITIGTSHCAAVNSYGQLFTWGTGYQGELGNTGPIIKQKPEIVSSALKFKINQVIVGDSHTSVVTDGCYVYIFGSIGNSHIHSREKYSQKLTLNVSKSAKNSNFISIPDLERHSVVDVKAANGVVCVLTDLGEVYMFDDCLDLIKAPVYQDTVIGSISTTDNVIYGIDKHKNQIFEWKYNRKIRLSASYESENCQLTYWSGNVYQLNSEFENLSLFSSRSQFVMFINDSSVNKNIGKRIDSIKPYKRSEFARNLVRNLSDYSTSAPVTPRFSKGIKREIQESEFPTDIDIEKVLEDHINQEREKQILKAVKPILHENLSFCFHLLKEFSIMKLIHKKTLAATLVPTSIEKILNRFEISYKSHAFQNIRISAEYKKTLIKLSENKQKSACKNLVKSIGDWEFKAYWYALAQIKEYQLWSIRKKKVVIGLVKIMKKHMSWTEKQHFDIWRNNIKKSKKSFKLTKIHTLRENITNIIDNRYSDSNDIEKGTNKLCSLINKIKHEGLEIWKKNIADLKLKTVSQKYFKNIQTKAIVLRVSYAFKRAYRDAFCSIKSYADYKCSSELYLIAVACNYKSLSKILYKFSFQKIKNLPKIIKFSKILTRTLKPRLLDSFDSVINFGAKFDLLVNVLSRLHLKALDLAFFRLKIKLNKSNTRYKLFETPDSSIFQESDMVLMQSVESFGDLTTTAGTTQKIKKYYSSEHSLLSMTDLKPKKLEMCQTPPLEILQTPRGTRHISSGIQTSLHFDKEPLSYQQRLIKNIMSKAGYPIENSKTTELKFIKPPWIPTSKTVEFSTSKIPKNTHSKRLEYDNHLRERLKFIHSKKDEITPRREPVIARRINSYPLEKAGLISVTPR